MNTSLSRRQMLSSASCGFGSLALSGLIGRASAMDNISANTPPLAARAQRVIFLCMSGGPAQMDTFDYKPQTGKKPHAGSVFSFENYGESGLKISELLPETAKHADKLCVLNGMHADTGIHAQSFLQLHTGDRLRERPSLGAWVGYGLGTENQNLPGFISLNSSRPSCHGSAFLPPVYQGTPIGVNGEPMTKATVPNISSDHLSMESKRLQLDFIQSLNREHQYRSQHDPRLEGVIQSMELGFRMQATAPELLDLSGEPQHVLDRYRVGRQKSVGTCRQTDFGRQCLLARRFCEAGVRFIEVNHGSWDQHKNHRRDLEANCAATDAPIAALLQDLEERGLLDSTLVIWGGEFGRPGLTPGKDKDQTGHNANGFTFWLAGGGVKPGFTYGATDPTGARAVEGKIHFRDLHATVLHLLGLPPNQLIYRHAGRDHRLTGPEGGRVVKEIFA
ncbi:MAG: DUF1501 domain-containing protein [Verrucomicrobiales bacterium]|nr:DUF1501 domain-containing protein [Verrucomicrobiales bacterium]